MSIYIMNLDGSNLHLISNQSDYCPDFSPDHTKIVFHSSRNGNTEIYTMNADGSNQLRLTNNSAQDGCAVWSPDGSQIAFQSDRDANGYFKIYVMNADGSSPTRLSELGNFSEWDPCWSTDGSKILFLKQDGIWTMSPDGTNRQILLSTTSDIQSAEWPSWSKDGAKITFKAYKDGFANIFVMNADGTNITQITHYNISNSGANFPAWSPDGSKIVYSYTEDYTNDYWEVYVINADGSGSPTQLTTIGGAKPKW